MTRRRDRATGNVGSSLVELLTADGTDVVGVARRIPPESRADVQWWEPTWPRPTWRACSATGAVVHLAWLIQPSHRPAEMWRTNVEGSTRVIEAVEAQAFRRWSASSIGAYSRVPSAGGSTVLADRGEPVLGYAWQKAYVERLLDGLEQRRPDVRVVRLRPL